MTNILIGTQPILRSPCPLKTCNCGYYDLVSNLSDESIAPKIQRYPGLTITKMQENIIVESIKKITTFDEYTLLRQTLKTRYGIDFELESDGKIKFWRNVYDPLRIRNIK